MSRSFLAWLLTTAGLALLSVSVVLVPNSAFADDGSGCDGDCVYYCDGFGCSLIEGTCSGECSCPNPPYFSLPTEPTYVRTDCANIPECLPCTIQCTPNQVCTGTLCHCCCLPGYGTYFCQWYFVNCP
jgi:hypothetical protein